MGGAQTRVWVDRWIPTLLTGHPTHLLGTSADGTLSVSSIIDQEHPSWHLNPIIELLYPEKHAAILDTPIGDPTRYGRFVYDANRRGRFLVKSGYRWLHDRNAKAWSYHLLVANVIESRKARCNEVFNNITPSPSQTIHAIGVAITSFLAARSRLAPPLLPYKRPPHLPSNWIHTLMNKLKINVDTSWMVGFVGGRTGGFAGIVVRNSEGCCIAINRREVWALSVCSVEASGVLEGCLLALQQGFSDIIIESDSLEVVSCLNCQIDDCSWEAFSILSRICALRNSFHAADYVASHSAAEVCDIVWFERPPSLLVGILNNDGLPCPPN
ncbi:hypothetical protein ACFX13_025382 [Malus domestica]